MPCSSTRIQAASLTLELQQVVDAEQAERDHPDLVAQSISHLRGALDEVKD